MNKEELIEQNCKRCLNYEICQSTGCAIKNEILEMKMNEESLIKYLEDEYRINNDEWKDAKNREDEIFYFGRLKQNSSILERVKSGKYE